MSSFLMGLDYGTGGAKATIIDLEGNVKAYAFEEYPILTPEAGWSEHEPMRYWEAACRLIRKVIADANVINKDIKGLAVSSALPSMVMIDGNGNPVNNAYNLMDRRATKQVQWVKDNVGEANVFEISKNRLDDHPMIINLLWEKENRPDDFRKVKKALTIDGFINYRLTGEYSGHYSGAAFYGVAYDLLNRRFNNDILEKIGIDPELFPTFYNCYDIIGQVTENAADATGLAPGIPVAAGQVDCNAGWSGAGSIQDGDIQMNLGTCGNFGIIHTKPIFYDSMIAFNYTTDSPEKPVYITVPTTTTGGGLIRFARDTFYVAEQKNKEKDVYDVMNEEARNVPVGSDALIVHPYLMGERTPIWDVYARGTIFGLSFNHTRGHIVRAMMESVAYALYDSFQIIVSAGQKINAPIILNEGGAKSSLWRSIITDVFNVPTVLVENRVGAPFGDAVLAGVATGFFKDFSVARQWTRLVDPMEPNDANHDVYQEYFKAYKTLYTHVKQDYRDLTRLRTLGKNA